MNRRERTHMLAVAALLHDVGKVGQRGKAGTVSPSNLETFCKEDPERPVRTHVHAAWTAQFVEEHLRPVWEGHGEQQVLRWAAAHHVPSNALEWVVAEADRISSGMDRPKSEDRPGHDPSRVPLESVLARVTRGGAREPREPAWVPLRPLTMSRDDLFPTRKAPRPEDYEVLWKGLCDGADALCKGLRAWQGVEPDWLLAGAASLLERYTWCVPASTIDTPRDVSLWDHARSAAAIAACLAHDDRCEHDEGFVRDRNEVRYALVCADISGIQNYVHALKSEGARRSLTGRSFYVQLLQDAVARGVCARFELPLICVLYQGGGKVWFLLPSSVTNEARQFAEEVDLALWTETGGLLGFGVGAATLTGRDMAGLEVGRKWADAFKDLQAARLRRMVGLADPSSYERLFGPSPFKQYACSQCHRETDSDHSPCGHCLMTAEVGRRLGRRKVVVPMPSGAPSQGFSVPAPAPLKFSYVFQERAEHSPGVVLSFDLPDENEWREHARNGTVLTWWPIATSEPIEFEELAKKNPGVPRIAVLRADVDGLGDLFEGGLPHNEQSLSRIAALSRTLSVFFGGYVPAVVNERWRDTVRIVFSGGDDVFLVGSFFAIPEVALWLRDEFQSLGNGNPALTLSAGIAIQGAKAPLIATAERAREAEHTAKRFERNGRCKDAVCLFGQPLSWAELQRAGALVGGLVHLVGGLPPSDAGLAAFQWQGLPSAQGRLPRSILRTLGGIWNLHWMGQGGGGATPSLDRMVNSHRWRWIASYALGRAGRERAGAAGFLAFVSKELLSASASPGNVRPLIDWLSPVVEWSFLLTRPYG